MRWIFRFIKLFVLIVIIYGIGRCTVVFVDSQVKGERNAYLQQQSDSSIVVHWQTENHAMGVVRYGEDIDYLEFLGIEDGRKKVHAIKLTGLKPDTRYYYTVGDVEGPYNKDKKIAWFRTSPKPGTVQPTRIWVIGDSGEAGQTSQAVRDAMKKWVLQHPRPDRQDIDVWLALGDIAYRSGSNDQYQSGLFESYPDLLGKTSLWPVYGNHDARRWTYFKLFDLPENAEAGGVPSNTENYYAFDYADVHFVVLDSQDGSVEADSEMLAWLKRDLAQNSRNWTIVAFHHPPYTKGSHNSDDAGDSRGRMKNMREKVLPILEAAGVDLVLSGHSHMYERSYLLDCHYQTSDHFSDKNIVSRGIHGKDRDFVKPAGRVPHQGTVYVVAGSSSKVDQGPLNHPANKIGLMQAGSLLIDIDGNQLTSRFINSKGEVSDEFSISKDPGYQSSYKGCVN